MQVNTCVVATARAGNVIGGGDWADDRLIPDLVRSLQKNEKLSLRNQKLRGLGNLSWNHCEAT